MSIVKAAKSASDSREYHVSHQGVVRGPFPASFVSAMVMSGQISPDAMVRQVGASDWIPLAQLVGSPPNSGTSSTPRPASNASKSSLGTWLVVCIAGPVLLVVFIAIFDSLSGGGSHKRRPAPLSSAISSPTPAVYARPSSPPVYATPTPSRQAVYIPPPSPVRQSSWLTTSSTPIPMPSPSRAVYPGSTVTAPAPPPLVTITGAGGRTYSVSHSDYSRLVVMRAPIDAAKPKIDKEEAALESLGRQIESRRPYVNSLSEASVDQFNAMVDDFNHRSKLLDADVDRFNVRVDKFNAELERVGTLIH